MKKKNKDWLNKIINDNIAEDNQNLKQDDEVSENKGKVVEADDAFFDGIWGENGIVVKTKGQEKQTKIQSGVYGVDIQEAMFGEPDKYLNNVSSSKYNNNNVLTESEFVKDDMSSQTTEDAEEQIVEENIEGSENMEGPKVVDEPTSKTDSNEEKTIKPGIKNLKFNKKLIALIIAGSVVISSAGCLIYKTGPNRKVKKMNASEITTTNNQDNINSLSKIEGCLKLSKAMKEYQDNNSYITNLDIGTVDVIDGKITELTDTEYNDIVNLLNKLDLATKEEKQTDNYKQMIKQFVGYSSKVNAYIVYYAPQLINQSILSELDDDGEKILEVKDEEFMVTYDYSANTILPDRTDGGVGAASYSLTPTGKVMDDLTEDLNKGTSSTILIDSFVNDSTKTVLNMESTITKNSDDSLIVEYSKETNEEIENRVEDAKLQMYRKLSQNNGKIRYGYFVPRDSVKSSQSQEQASSNVKTYVKTMVKTM